jgi:hypothetical protein
MKFLVLWHFDLPRLGPEVAPAVMQMPDYAKKLMEDPTTITGKARLSTAWHTPLVSDVRVQPPCLDSGCLFSN